MNWQLQEAKSKFSQLVNQAIDEGPQIVTRHGEKVVVVLSISDYEKMVQPPPSLLNLLLNSPLTNSGLIIERDKEDFGRESIL
ncbi:MAG: type II toxin-antitoxin system Phd/YefM family antitoxin [Ardenticatenaceae bacterium]|nr:type II toxin-antitoxin system Phd/YefM family antitoxin [Ardenticatenaceae bacterium]